jgi:formylglycine-generating enzyme required for sulfatase activity
MKRKKSRLLLILILILVFLLFLFSILTLAKTTAHAVKGKTILNPTPITMSSVPCTSDLDCSSAQFCNSSLVCANKVVGLGIVPDPFMIYNCTDLQNMNNNLNASYALARDIDCSEAKNWIYNEYTPRRNSDGSYSYFLASYKGFKPIGQYTYNSTSFGVPIASTALVSEKSRFYGNLNGRGFKIKNLYLDLVYNTTTFRGGLIAFSYGNISNVILENIDFNCLSYCGGVSSSNYGIISNVSVSGVIKSINLARNSYVGGISGNSGKNSLIENSASFVSINGWMYVGGIVGDSAGIIKDSFFRGSVSGDAQVGGIIGTGVSGAIIRNCYSAGNVSGRTSTASVVGYIASEISNSFTSIVPNSIQNYSLNAYTYASAPVNFYYFYPSSNILKCYVYYNNSWRYDEPGCTKVFDINYFKNSSNAPMNTWDFTNIWAIDANFNEGYPYLKWQKREIIPIIPPATIVNMSLIPAGRFVMGDNTSALARHNVTLNAFYIDKYEVSKELWNSVGNWSLTRGYNIGPASAKASNHPVQNMQWYSAVKWANARSEMEGFKPVYYTDYALTNVYREGNFRLNNTFVNWSANGYRLPTEAEWEYAARGNVTTCIYPCFPWSSATGIISHEKANYYSNETVKYDLSPTRGYHPRYNDGIMPYTSPVGSFQPNGYGLYDMAGNVFEWCWDWLSVPYAPGAVTNPLGPNSGNGRIIRGGSWGGKYPYYAFIEIVSYRNYNAPDGQADSLGFRTVRKA